MDSLAVPTVVVFNAKHHDSIFESELVLKLKKKRKVSVKRSIAADCAQGITEFCYLNHKLHNNNAPLAVYVSCPEVKCIKNWKDPLQTLQTNLYEAAAAARTLGAAGSATPFSLRRALRASVDSLVQYHATLSQSLPKTRLIVVLEHTAGPNTSQDAAFRCIDDETGLEFNLAEEVSSLLFERLNASTEEGEISVCKIKECELFIMAVVASAHSVSTTGTTTPADDPASAGVTPTKKRKANPTTVPNASAYPLLDALATFAGYEERSDEEYVDSTPTKRQKIEDAINDDESDTRRRSGRKPKRKMQHDAADDDDLWMGDETNSNNGDDGTEYADEDSDVAISTPRKQKARVGRPPKKRIVLIATAYPPGYITEAHSLASKLSTTMFFVRSSNIITAFQDFAFHVLGLEGAELTGVPMRGADQLASRGAIYSILVAWKRASQLEKPQQQQESPPALPFLGESGWRQSALKLFYLPKSVLDSKSVFIPAKTAYNIAFLNLSNYGTAGAGFSFESHILQGNRVAFSENGSTKAFLSHMLCLRASQLSLVVLDQTAPTIVASEHQQRLVFNVNQLRVPALSDLVKVHPSSGGLLGSRHTLQTKALFDSKENFQIPTLFNQPPQANVPAIAIPLQTPLVDPNQPVSSSSSAVGFVNVLTSTYLERSTRFFPYFEEESILFSSRESDPLKALLAEIKRPLLENGTAEEATSFSSVKEALYKLLAATQANDAKLFPVAKSSGVARRRELFTQLWQEVRRLCFVMKNDSAAHKAIYDEVLRIMSSLGVLPADGPTVRPSSASTVPSLNIGGTNEQILEQVHAENRGVNNSELAFKEDLSWGRSRRRAPPPPIPENKILSADQSTLYSMVWSQKARNSKTLEPAQKPPH